MKSIHSQKQKVLFNWVKFDWHSLFCSKSVILCEFLFWAARRHFEMKREREREAERFVGKHKSAANCKLWKMQLMALRRLGESWKLKIYTNAMKDAAHTLGGILAAGTESLHWRGARGGLGAGSGFHSHRAASAAVPSNVPATPRAATLRCHISDRSHIASIFNRMELKTMGFPLTLILQFMNRVEKGGGSIPCYFFFKNV